MNGWPVYRGTQWWLKFTLRADCPYIIQVSDSELRRARVRPNPPSDSTCTRIITNRDPPLPMSIPIINRTRVQSILNPLHPLTARLYPQTHTNMMLAFSPNNPCMFQVLWLTRRVAQEANWQRAESGWPFYERVLGRLGRIRLCSNGIHVGFPPFLPIHYSFLFVAWFRLFVGDLSNDVSDDVLSGAFNKYSSFQKARVIRDRLSQKVRLVATDVRKCNLRVTRLSMVSSRFLTQRTSWKLGRRWMVGP